MKLAEDHEAQAYLEDVEAFLSLLRTEPSILACDELRFFRDYLQRMGATLTEEEGSDVDDDDLPDLEDACNNQKNAAATSDEVADDPDTDDDSLPDLESAADSGAPDGRNFFNSAMGEQEEEEESESSEGEIISSDESENGSSEGDGDDDVMAPESDPLPEQPEVGKEPSEADMETAAEKKQAAAEAKGNGEWGTAMDLYTEALMLMPSALTFANRADCLLRLASPRPTASIADCDAALKLNPDSAKAMKIRGKAHKLLGNWEQAVRDLQGAMRIDFDDAANDMLTAIRGRFAKIETVRVRNRRRSERRDKAEKIKTIKRRQKANRRARRAQEAQESMGGMPGMGGMGGMPGMGGMGGMPGMGGMGGMGGGMPGGMGGGMPGGMGGMPPGLMEALTSDPELMAAMQNPKVMAAMQASMGDPSKAQEMMKDPEVAAAYEKIMSKLGKFK